MSETFTRTCADCGIEMTITVEDDGQYEGGAFFGEMKIPADDAEEISAEEKTVDLGEDSFEVTVVEYDSYDMVEYWECEDCYEGEEDEED